MSARSLPDLFCGSRQRLRGHLPRAGRLAHGAREAVAEAEAKSRNEAAAAVAAMQQVKQLQATLKARELELETLSKHISAEVRGRAGDVKCGGRR